MQEKRSEKRPPSKRYLEVFNRVDVEGRSVAATAAEMGIKEDSVRTIVGRVRTWIKTQGGRLERMHPRSAALVNVREMRLARLEHMLEEAMNAWYRSTKPQERQTGHFNRKKVLQGSDVTTTTKTGNTQYLILAREILAEISAIRTGLPHNDLEHEHVEQSSPETRLVDIDRAIAVLGFRAGAAAAGRAPQSQVIDANPS